ncbi:MAG: protein kinase, partial [Gemmatimonadetes bacterium]|nr:protein kinase [Gemmatimonadota bacterium]
MAKPTEDRWHEIDAVFAAALEQEPSQREAFLARACRADAGLRQAVAALLLASAQADSFLETPIFTLAGGLAVARLTGTLSEGADASHAAGSESLRASTEAVSPVRDLLGLGGRQISHFRVQEVLSCGGMGVVYRGQDLRLGRTVALKFLLPQYSLDSGAKERFLQEARAASLLDHPNICTIYEAGETEEGHLFLAMACYRGETLRERLARLGVLPIEEAVELARQIARGLGAAHEAGIVHRDLKPGNLMLAAEGTLKILDFGLAKVRDLSITRSGERAGTVAYMSPEQLQGEPVDGRSDLWSLGAVLYELLSGRLPFGAGHELSTAYRILYQEPVPLSSLRREIPAALEQLVARLLCKEPAGRYATAAAAMQVLEAVSAGSTVLAVEGGPEAVRPNELRRMRQMTVARRVVLVGGVALLAGVAGSLAITSGGTSAGSAATEMTEPLPVGGVGVVDRRSVAVLPFANLSESRENEYFSDGITDEILTTLANVGDLRVISRTSVMQYKGTAKSLQQIAAELGVVHILEGSVQRAGDRVRINAQLIDARTDAHLWAERYDRPLEDIFAVQSEIAQQIAQALQAELSSGERERLVRQPTTDPMAHDHVLRAREYLRLFTPSSTAAALSLLRSARELDPEYPDVYAALARAFHQRVVFSGGEELWDSSEVAARRAIAVDPEFAPGYAQLGWILDFRGDREAALEAHLQAVQLNPNHADGLANLYHYSFGRLDEAARWWGPALRADPNNSFSVWLAGRTYQHLGMPARARPLLEKSIAITPDLVWYQYSLIMNFL